jgi:hypothetical protein
MGARARPESLCRDLPAISRIDRGGPQRPQYGYERSQIRVLAAAARCRLAGRDMARPRVRPVETFSSDDCPFRFDDDAGKTGQEARTLFRWVPNGTPGVAGRLPILFSEGVVKGQDFVALTATNHAKLYCRYPGKGSIMIGADADIAIWAEKKTTLTQDLMQHGERLYALRGTRGGGMADQDPRSRGRRHRQRARRRLPGIRSVLA